MDFYFEFMNNKKLNEARVRDFIKYLKEHKNSLIRIGKYTFDKDSLSSKIMLSHCLDCERYNGRGNCCQGNPYSMPPQNRKDLLDIAGKVVEIIPDNQSKNLIPILKSDSLYTKSGAVTTKGNPDGHCFFSYKVGDMEYSKCAIHAYCLENGLNPVKYKPYTCSLFPLFAVRTPSNNTVVMCANKETSSFSPYFYTLTTYLCVNEGNLDRLILGDCGTQYLKSIHRSEVLEDKVPEFYHEAYIEQENVLRFFVGDSVYSELVGKFR